MNSGKNHVRIAFVILTLILCYFPLCHRIGLYCVQSWDESRNIVNALEMLKNHHWFTRYFENQPDMWELKPPFLVWCQALSFKIFGLNEVAARLPSMFFSMGTVLLLIWAGHKITGNLFTGILASLILVSSMGYVGHHVARFGDHDAPLVFFSTAMLCLIYLFSINQENKFLVLAFVALFLGWFTKSIIVFMFLPGLVIWFLLNKQVKRTLRNKAFWISLGALVVLIAMYYLLRENQSPGYMQQVWMNEMFGRYFDLSPNYHYQKNDFWYYWTGFFDGRFHPFFMVFLAGSALVLVFKKLPHRHLLLYLLLNFVVFFLIISAGTKNFWYDAPLYPLVALFLGVLIVDIYTLSKPLSIRLAIMVLVCTMIYPAYSLTVQFAMNRDQNESHPLQSLCYFLKNENHPLPKNLKIVHDGHYAALYLYIEKARTRGRTIVLAKPAELKTNDTILVNQKYFSESLDTMFKSSLIYHDKGCELRKIEK